MTEWLSDSENVIETQSVPIDECQMMQGFAKLTSVTQHTISAWYCLLDQGGHKPGKHGKHGKLRGFEKLLKSHGKFRENVHVRHVT